MNWEQTKRDPLIDIYNGKKAIENMYGKRSINIIALGVEIAEILKYYFETKTVYETKGYIKKRGPDGKTWLEKKRFSLWRGNGNKAKRKVALLTYLKTGHAMEVGL